ncbi:MAG: hypothetical protein WAO58_09550 [Fimbriimonadaceae bacterium]
MKRTRKTTLMIDEGLYASVKREAAERGRSISSIVAEAVRKYMAEPRPQLPVVLPSFGGGGIALPSHIDISDTSAVLEHLDEGLPFEKLR